VRLGQEAHAPSNNKPDEVLIAGKEVSEEQSCHACPKLVTSEELSSGKSVREEHLRHAAKKLVPDEVSIAGKEVREEQLYHALLKLVPDEVLISGKDVREEQSRHVLLKLVTLPNALLAAAPLSTKYASMLVISESLNCEGVIRYPITFFKKPLFGDAATPRACRSYCVEAFREMFAL
jgi:hypothetical protein